MRRGEEQSFAFTSCQFSECICFMDCWEPWLTMDRTKWDNKIKDNNPLNHRNNGCFECLSSLTNHSTLGRESVRI